MHPASGRKAGEKRHTTSAEETRWARITPVYWGSHEDNIQRAQDKKFLIYFFIVKGILIMLKEGISSGTVSSTGSFCCHFIVISAWAWLDHEADVVGVGLGKLK